MYPTKLPINRLNQGQSRPSLYKSRPKPAPFTRAFSPFAFGPRGIFLCTIGLIAFFSSHAMAADSKDAAPAAAEVSYGYRCEADLFYTWRRTPQKKVTQGLPGQKQPDGADSPEEPIEQFFDRVSERGAAEKPVRDQIQQRIASEKGRALAACRSDHENQGDCVAERIRRVEPTYRNADYLSRKAITDGIKSDCENGFGRCVSARAGDIVCTEDRPPEVAPEATPAAAGAAGAAPAGKEDPKKKK
jgi:hypothetical protein